MPLKLKDLVKLDPSFANELEDFFKNQNIVTSNYLELSILDFLKLWEEKAELILKKTEVILHGNGTNRNLQSRS